MAISKDQIITAIEAITATGQKPTTITIREHLGTGSLGTINPILKEWRENQAPPTLPPASPTIPVPQPFIDGVQAIIPQLWTVAAETANTLLATERAAWNAEREELTTSLTEATALEAAAAADLEAAHTLILNNIDTSNTQIDNLTATIANLKTNHADALETEIKARIIAEQDAAVLRATNNQMQTRIDDLRGQNAELKSSISDINKELANQITATHAAVKCADATEATIKIIGAELQTANTQIDYLTNTIDQLKTDHTAALEAQTTARIMAEQAAAVSQATIVQMQTRLDDLLNVRNDLNEKITDLKTEYDAQTKLTHAAESRAAAAEATATAQRLQIIDLKENIEQLRTPEIEAAHKAISSPKRKP